MADGSVQALEPRECALLEKAQQALAAGNSDYAIRASSEVLSVSPRCLIARRVQRAAQLNRFAAANRLVAKARARISSSPFIFGVNERNPQQSFASAEKILAVDPTSTVGLKLLGQSAEWLHWPEIAVFAYEALRELRPNDRETLLVLAAALASAGEPTEALRIAEQVLKEAPADPVALLIIRDASVTKTMSAGNWARESHFNAKPHVPDV